MLIGVQGDNNLDIGFCIDVRGRADEAKRLIREGFEAWICLSEIKFPTDNFTEKDGEWIYGAGVSEPAVFLLDKYHIPHGDAEDCFDADGNLTPEYADADIEWVY